MAKPARPDANPPTKAAARKSTRTMPSMTSLSPQEVSGVWMACHLEGRPRCTPVLQFSEFSQALGKDLSPPRRRRRYLGLMAGRLGRPRKPRESVIGRLFYHPPCRLQNRIRNQSHDCGCRDQQGVAHFPAEENGERDNANQRRQPVANGDPAKQDAGAEDRADRRTIGAANKALHVRIFTVAREQRRRDQNENERREENADGRDQRAPEAGDEIADEGRSDDDRTGTYHSDRDRDEKLPFVEPSVLLDEPLLEKRHNHEAAAERERSGLKKEQQQLAECRIGCCGGSDEQRHRSDLQFNVWRFAKEIAVIEDADDPRADEQQGYFGLKNDRHREPGERDAPLQPILHAELRKAVTGVKDQGDHGWAHAVEDRGDGFEIAEIDVKRPKRGNHHEIRKDEGPAADPGPPETPAKIADVNADLNRKRPRQRLADRDGFAHLLFREPAAFADQFALHLSDERNRPAKTDRPQTQEVEQQLRQPPVWRLHRPVRHEGLL